MTGEMTVMRYIPALLLCWFTTTWSTSEVLHSVEWDSDVISCHGNEVLVIEEAFYLDPAPEVCDHKCRPGLNASGEADDCYFRENQCVQRASASDVILLYRSCLPAHAPTRCNISGVDLPASLSVGFSCLEGNILNPYTEISQEVHKGILSVQSTNPVTTSTEPYISQCLIHSHSSSHQHKVKITALHSPYVSNDNDTSQSSSRHEIKMVIGDGQIPIETSIFPRWWMILEEQFEIEFKMEMKEEMFPVWVVVENDAEDKLTITCQEKIVTTPPITTQDTSTFVPQRTVEINGNDRTFSIQELIIAIFVTVVVIAVIISIVAIVCHRVKKKGQNEASPTAQLGNIEHLAQMNFPAYNTTGSNHQSRSAQNVSTAHCNALYDSNVDKTNNSAIIVKKLTEDEDGYLCSGDLNTQTSKPCGIGKSGSPATDEEGYMPMNMLSLCADYDDCKVIDNNCTMTDNDAKHFDFVQESDGEGHYDELPAYV